MTETTGVKDPGKRRALKYAGVAAGAAILGRLTSGIGAPSADAPKAVSTASQAATVPQTGKNRETSDLSFKDFLSLSHKDQDQKLKDLIGKDISLQIDDDKVTLLKVNSTYWKDGQESSYNNGDKIPDGSQLVSEHYILSGGSKIKESTGLGYVSFDVIMPVYLNDNPKGIPNYRRERPGYFTDYSAYTKALQEARYTKEYLDNLWIRTDPKKLPYIHLNDTNSRDIPNGSTFKLSVDGDPKATYPPTPRFQDVTLAPQVSVSK